MDKTSIIAFVNKAYAGSYSGTDLDTEINMTLQDLSKMHCLIGTDSTQSTASDGYYLSYPSDCLNTEQAIISVALSNYKPLKYIPGGWLEYKQLIDQLATASRSRPEWMTFYNKKIYLYSPPDDVYAAEIQYYKLHGDVNTSIDFDDDWEEAINCGTVYHKALLAADKEYINIWQPKYYEKKEEMRLLIPRDAAIGV